MRPPGEDAARMPWVPWQPPQPCCPSLARIDCALADPSAIHTQQNNRGLAAAASQALPNLVVREMQRHQKYLEQRMTRLRREAMRLIADDPELNRRFRLMLTTTGIAGDNQRSSDPGRASRAAPDARRTPVGGLFSGLDPRLFKSGKSVEKRPRISCGGKFVTASCSLHAGLGRTAS